MKELGLQQLCQEISKKYFHKEFRHQITYNARLKSTGGRYILKTGNIGAEYVDTFNQAA